MAPHVNAIVATLDLVCPPIPNSSLSGISQNKEVVQILRRSDFYMIGGRARAHYTDVTVDDEGKVCFGIQVQGGARGNGFIDIRAIPPIAAIDGDVRISFGYSENFLNFYRVGENGEKTLVAKFHPEDILWRRGRRERFISGLENHLDLACYDLLYVGIATKTDSYDRLIAKGHQARQEILSDEPQRHPGAHVSDEIYLFLFNIDPLLIKSWRPQDEFEVDDTVMTYSNERLVADAEKAFISILKPSYNSQLYKNYPKGRDGLYDHGYTGYSYSISDGLTFRTPFGSMKGARERNITLSNDADSISIKGDSVRLHIAGADYEIDASST